MFRKLFPGQPQVKPAPRRRLLMAAPAIAAAVAATFLLWRGCNDDGKELNHASAAIGRIEPCAEPIRPPLVQSRDAEAQRHQPEDREAERPAEQEDAGPRSVLEEMSREFSEESITCQRTSRTFDFSRMAFMLHFDHNSPALSNPLRSPESIPSPTGLFEMLESEQDENVLIEVLEMLDSIGVARERDRAWNSRVEEYLRAVNEYQPGPFYEEGCVARAGNALLAASRVITILIDRSLEREGRGIDELADRMPLNLQEIFYDRLSIALFEHDAAFNARFTSRVLGRLSEDHKWEFFERLFDFVFINAMENGSFRSTAREVRGTTRDPTIRRGISRIFQEVERREQNPLGDW